MNAYRVHVATFEPGRTEGRVVDCGHHNLPSEYRAEFHGGCCISARYAKDAASVLYVLVGNSYYRVNTEKMSVSVLPADAALLDRHRQPTEPVIDSRVIDLGRQTQIVRTQVGSQVLSVTQFCGRVKLWVWDACRNTNSYDRTIEVFKAGDEPDPNYTRLFISTVARNEAGGFKTYHVFERLAPLLHDAPKDHPA